MEFDKVVKCLWCGKKVDEVNEQGLCKECAEPDPCEDCEEDCKKCKIRK
jgi:hypothetical protein